MDAKSKQWSVEETNCFLAIWSSAEIQEQFEGATRTKAIFQKMQMEMCAAGYFRTTDQIINKLKKLKMDYRDKKKDLSRSGKGRPTLDSHYYILDSVLGNGPAVVDDTLLQTYTEADSPTTADNPVNCNSTFISYPPPDLTHCPPEDSQDPDTSLCCWTKKEVQALLTLWANPAVQEELLLNVRNNKVYAVLSAQLAYLGFHKAPQKCREKIKKLKQEYKRIKGGGSSSSQKTTWFSIMDEVLSSKDAAESCSETAEPQLLIQSQSALDVDTDDETQWLPDEVQVLMTLWAQPNVQKQLLTTAATDQVFMNLSSELTLVGFNKTPHQCSLKVNNLIEEYRRIKAVEPHRDVTNEWFSILDSVLSPVGETSAEVDSAVLTQPESPEDQHGNDMFRACWTPDEIVVLVSRWAEKSIQEQHRSTPSNDVVYAQLSSELATDGFDKTTSQCRSKIKVLKGKYRRIKEQKDCKKQRSRWFAIMDRVLGHRKPKAEVTQGAEVMDSAPGFLQTSQQDLPETVKDLGCRLSFSSLCLLVPTLRLMCAFAWQVVQCCNVPHYGKVEELVRLVTELVPELLTPREKLQLVLRLRATMVLELCRNESTANLLNIQPHLKVIQNLEMDPTCDQEESQELENSKSDFVESVHILLEDTKEERKTFFKEVFPIHYGQQYEATLQTLVWKFISRLDYLLPIPDIKQTAQWLSDAPSVMEECGQLVLETEQLKALLHFHQQQTGSASKDNAQTQNMFLPRLSLPHKPNSTQLASEKQERPAGNADGQFDYSEDEDAIKEIHTEDELTLQDFSKGDEGLKSNDKQSDDLTAADCSNSKKSSALHCPYSDSQGSGLMQHIRKLHLIQEPRTANVHQKVDSEMCTLEMKSITNTCEYCGKVFKDLSVLKRHRETHTLLFHCDKCDKKYSSRWSLNVHRQIHMNGKPYLCSQCGRVFRTPYSLDFHVRIHTGDRHYKCHICGKTSIQHMTRHMRMHRGEKNYLCTECGKAFLSNGELRLHMRSHTGERPYTCKHCGKGFIAKCLLTVHMRQHTGESPYRCSVCPKSFQTLGAQKRHVMIHSNKKSFQCLKCGKIFRQENTFKMHVQTHS
ncbi:uncharacterized protein LOC131960563 [Centropristis striata]|uniref:uncharacterized protein LOC131960563 n=1 Tax=Centropristis striata TaxID=184440 RepID=UPI0027E1BBB7|nr:uncharacterized protein LOC131960563 [Centropristis striata]